ncbi:MAG TPA: NAD-dependent epimerase/dehydratase family protein [Rhodocyclaceae bacterium]|nr:NAD-dependent epimerase/dehydratase family protein [Rhodocyclaceae bacterium]
MDDRAVGVLGATSLVGDYLLPLLIQAGWSVTAFTRQTIKTSDDGPVWRQLISSPAHQIEKLPCWICAAPIWALPDYFDLLHIYGAKRIVVLSSTSRFTKDDSPDFAERAVARDLTNAETSVCDWAQRQGVEWIVLRPTMIYGKGKDRNVSDIARFIRRWHFFPLIGAGRGLRQPIHASDVAQFCVVALSNVDVKDRAFNLCGGETLSYRDMVERIGTAMALPVRCIEVPRTLLRVGVKALSFLSRFRSLSPALVDRMAQDLIFDGSEANRLLGVQPRNFVMTAGDLPLSGGVNNKRD